MPQVGDGMMNIVLVRGGRGVMLRRIKKAGTRGTR